RFSQGGSRRRPSPRGRRRRAVPRDEARRDLSGFARRLLCDDVEDMPVLRLAEFGRAGTILFLEMGKLEVSEEGPGLRPSVERHAAVLDIPAVVRTKQLPAENPARFDGAQ